MNVIVEKTVDFWIGIAVSLVCVVAAYFWKETLYPLIQSWVYKGVRIDGQWNATSSHDSFKEGTVEVMQRGIQIFGTVRKKGSMKPYRFKGEFNNNILTATYTEE